MEYEPIKERLRKGISRSIMLRKFFYRGLGLLFLREWYVKRELRQIFVKTEPMAVLDAGSGFGQYSYYCVRRFPGTTVLGVEIHEDQVADGNRFAERSGLTRLRFEKGDITRLAYRNRFDLILNIDVLEHIEKDGDLLRLFNHALAPGGSLVLSTPTVYRRIEKDSAFVGEHVRDGYSEEEIRSKMKEAGLVVQKIVYGYGVWGDLSWQLGIRNVMKCASLGIPGKILGFFYFIVVFPIVAVLMVLDYFWKNKRGTGFIITAARPMDSDE